MPRDPYGHLMQDPAPRPSGRGAGGPSGRRAAEPPSDADPADLLAEMSELLSAGLARHNRDLLRLLAPLGEGLRDALQPFAAAPPTLGARSAGEAADGLEARVARLERMLRERAAPAPPPPVAPAAAASATASATVPQDTLFLQCRVGGRTAGRVRVVNPSSRSARIVARPAAALDAEGRPLPGVRVALREDEPTVEAGAARLVGVEVDLADAPAGPGRVETALDLALDGQPSLRLWIEVDVHDLA